MKRFLITTADEHTWPKDQPILFLGEWCKRYDRRHIWASMDSITVPYHWNDRKKLHRDYLYLQRLYEELLQELTEKLNDIHGVNYSLRYWRILIGPWLCFFVEMLFDRWEMIQKVINDYDVAGVKVLDMTQDQVVPNDEAQFHSLYVEDSWNEAIYGALLQGWTNVPVEKEQLDTQRRLPKTQLAMASNRRLISKLARHAASFFSQCCIREDNAFFISSYLPILQDFRLQWLLGQVPNFWSCIQPPQAQVDWTRRHWQLGRSGVKDFPAIVREMIPRHIPKLYIEGYSELRELCRSLPWPKKPRLIFSSNSFYSDDVFKAWAAEKVEKGAPFVVGQHGGNYGIGRWESSEEHQYAISDCWLSWGWIDDKRPNIKPVGNLKMVGYDLGWDPDGHALMVEMIVPRYSYRIFSMPVASQWLDYFEAQCRFIDALPERIRRKLIVRLRQQDYGWCQKQRWKDRYPNINLDDGQVPIAPLIKKSRVYVSTYNATTFLESLAMNIPTIVFWNPDLFELRDSAVSYFERLKAVGIFHETPESAAYKMMRIWDDVASWWNSKSIQEVRKEFCYLYSRMPEQPLKDIEKILRQISNTTIK